MERYTDDKEDDARDDETTGRAKSNPGPGIRPLIAGYKTKPAQWDSGAHETTQEAGSNEISVRISLLLLENNDLRVWGKLSQWLLLNLLGLLNRGIHGRHSVNLKEFWNFWNLRENSARVFARQTISEIIRVVLELLNIQMHFSYLVKQAFMILLEDLLCINAYASQCMGGQCKVSCVDAHAM
jgi:hypothetical protein